MKIKAELVDVETIEAEAEEPGLQEPGPQEPEPQEPEPQEPAQEILDEEEGGSGSRDSTTEAPDAQGSEGDAGGSEEGAESAASSPPALSADVAAMVAKVMEARFQAIDAESKVKLRTELLKDAKEMAKEAASALRGSLSRLCDACQAEVEEKFKRDVVPSRTVSADGMKEVAVSDADSWKSVRLDTFGLSQALLTKLADAGLETMGQVADYSSAGKKLVDIKGIGAGAATKIEKAMDVFWATRGSAFRISDIISDASIRPASVVTKKAFF